MMEWIYNNTEIAIALIGTTGTVIGAILTLIGILIINRRKGGLTVSLLNENSVLDKEVLKLRESVKQINKEKDELSELINTHNRQDTMLQLGGTKEVLDELKNVISNRIEAKTFYLKNTAERNTDELEQSLRDVLCLIHKMISIFYSGTISEAERKIILEFFPKIERGDILNV